MGTEDVRYPVAMEIKKTFENIPGNPYEYEYHEGPGVHEWVFWDEWIQHFLDTLALKGGKLTWLSYWTTFISCPYGMQFPDSHCSYRKQ